MKAMAYGFKTNDNEQLMRTINRLAFKARDFGMVIRVTNNGTFTIVEFVS